MQLVLPFTIAPRYTFNSLVVHPGIGPALATLAKVLASGDKPFPHILLHGPAGTGKTHVLNAVTESLAQKSGTATSVRVFSMEEPQKRFAALEELISQEGSVESLEAVAVDDVHLMDAEEAKMLWTLSNKLTRTGAPLLMASLFSPDELFLHDEHLRSRIVSGLVLQLEPPEDAVRMLILDKMAGDKNVRISREVAGYLVTRKSRNVKELQKLVDVLDQTSLQLKRRITVPLIKMLEKEGVL